MCGRLSGAYTSRPAASSSQPTCTVAQEHTAGVKASTYESSTARQMVMRENLPRMRYRLRSRARRMRFQCWIGPPVWSSCCVTCVEWPGGSTRNA
eukprot:529290-Prymnesium_polylepis.1